MTRVLSTVIKFVHQFKEIGIKRINFDIDVATQEFNEHTIIAALEKSSKNSYLDGWAAAEAHYNKAIDYYEREVLDKAK